MKKVLLIIPVILVLVIGGYASKGKIAPLSWALWGDVNQESGIGVRGYDVVSYHQAPQPVVGEKAYRSIWNDTSWHFANAQNKALFDADPERYAPSYGGYCAYAILNNFTADVDPLAWHIQDGNLYLFASAGPRDNWVSEVAQGAIQKSDQNWEQR